MIPFGGNELLRTSWAAAVQTLDDVALADVEEQQRRPEAPRVIPLVQFPRPRTVAAPALPLKATQR